ncbi:response regulator [Methyloraptor flagellatus]|uniref:histidine kinase n=1 Tax=Methyloraptor flagellatus TaxID=3162530 RepID=A0AAU7X771_9HYPH
MVSQNARSGWSYILDDDTKILFVDDDPILREFAIVHLSTPTALVELAADGQEAWAKLTTGDYDIALIDIEMPGIDGYTLVERIRSDARLSHLPVIMVTGREDIISIDRAFASGATSFAAKPVNWRQLSYEIRYVLRNMQVANEARKERDRAEILSSTKSSVLSALRHELKTPLNAVLGFASLVRMRAGGRDPELDAYVSEIEKAGRNLSRTVSDLLLYSDLIAATAPQREDECDLGEMIEGAIAEARDGASDPVPVLLPQWPVSVSCDRAVMVTALCHLVSNALRHGGGVGLGVSATLSASGDLSITVADRGPGMDPSRLAACLEPFEQADMSITRNIGGLGLGLSIARTAAALHGGRLDVNSRPGFGTTVTFNVPASRVHPFSDQPKLQANARPL